MTDLTNAKRSRLYSWIEIGIIVLLSCVPLFASFPYRVNIFLSFEGAYRLSEGQVPYRDFGMPLGFMYWVIPSLFFKIFGAQLITLVKAQVLINILSGLAFRSILKSIQVHPGIRLLSVLLYCLSYSFFNFWPWYNHTVIVYEMIALAFLMKFISSEGKKFRWFWLIVSALFVFFSFFTKQDGGGLAFMLCCALLLYNSIIEKSWFQLPLFVGSFALFAFLIIFPFTKFGFGYWFNYGQAPHTARFSFFEIIEEFFYSSQWIKFYIFVILLLVLASYKKWKDLLTDKKAMIFLLLTLGILAEAAILQVTSYTPPDNNIFFHSFAFAFILVWLNNYLCFDFFKRQTIIVCTVGLLLWWSGTYWKYMQRIIDRVKPPEEQIVAGGENIVNRQTYMLNRDTADIPMSEWVFTGLKSFEKVYMPKPTADGIHRLLQMDLVKSKKKLNVLNMSELTPLAVEIPYEPEKGTGYPLWHHLGVGMFNKQAAEFEKKIAEKKYDLVLFEYIPNLNNFFPFRVRDSLKIHYQLVDSFHAPRRGDTNGVIEVYARPSADSLPGQ